VPTYIVAAAEGRLSTDLKQEIAAAITRAHSEATGAQAFFAQVVFHDIAAGNHFLAGQPTQSDHIFVRGEIRAGRSPQQKHKLLEKIVNAVVDKAGTPPRHVWVYLAELSPAQMVEFGRVLPEPGREAQWLEAMSEVDRDFLNGLG
jgi:phenylpyruvate tautomerase PptA (4-oxalocrotonate tautomerase family)